MASAGEISDPIPVVLRVKRKRVEQPVGTLMITKRVRVDPLQMLDTIDTSVFHFVGTVSNHTVNEKQILDKVRQHKDHSKISKLNPLARLSLSDVQKKMREQKKASSQSHRYKLVSESRSRSSDCEVGTSRPPHSDDETTGNDIKTNAKTALNFHLFDIEEDSNIEQSSPPKAESASNTSSTLWETDILNSHSEITCNSTQLIREAVDTKSTSEFVYDLYYTKQLAGQRVSSIDWSSMMIRDYADVELVHDIIDSDDEYCQDEDEDSNDENNWRNDYPDEDDLLVAASDSSGDDEINDHFRFREAFLDDDVLHDNHDNIY